MDLWAAQTNQNWKLVSVNSTKKLVNTVRRESVRKIDDINWKNKDVSKDLFQSKRGVLFNLNLKSEKSSLKRDGVIKEGGFY